MGLTAKVASIAQKFAKSEYCQLPKLAKNNKKWLGTMLIFQAGGAATTVMGSKSNDSRLTQAGLLQTFAPVVGMQLLGPAGMLAGGLLGAYATFKVSEDICKKQPTEEFDYDRWLEAGSQRVGDVE